MCYGITFSLDWEMYSKFHNLDVSDENLKNNWAEDFKKIKSFMLSKNFQHHEGLFFTSKGLNAVETVLVFQKLVNMFDWFYSCIKMAHMLRIEESCSLREVIETSKKVV